MDLDRTSFRLVARLQCGHVELQKHLFRINVVNTPICLRCKMDVPEYVKHYLNICPAYTVARKALHSRLASGQPARHRNIYPVDKLLQRPKAAKYLDDLVQFIIDTKRFNILVPPSHQQN